MKTNPSKQRWMKTSPAQAQLNQEWMMKRIRKDHSSQPVGKRCTRERWAILMANFDPIHKIVGEGLYLTKITAEGHPCLAETFYHLVSILDLPGSRNISPLQAFRRNVRESLKKVNKDSHQRIGLADLRPLSISLMISDPEIDPEDQVLDTLYYIHSLENITKIDMDLSSSKLLKVMVTVPYESYDYYLDRSWEDINCLGEVDTSVDKKRSRDYDGEPDYENVMSGKQGEPIRNKDSQPPAIIVSLKLNQDQLKNIHQRKQNKDFLEFASSPKKYKGMTEENASRYLEDRIRMLKCQIQRGNLNQKEKIQYGGKIARIKNAKEAMNDVWARDTAYEKYCLAYDWDSSTKAEKMGQQNYESITPN